MKAERWIRISGSEEKILEAAEESRESQSVTYISIKYADFKTGCTRFMGGVKEDVKFIGVRQEAVEDKVRWRQMIGCGLS